MTIHTDVAVIGAGSVGIAVAYYLKKLKPTLQVSLIDSELPLSLTSSVSGENFRNWWPHPVMKSFMDRSIDLLHQLNLEYGAIINSNSGYLLATRDSNPDALIENLQSTFQGDNDVRLHVSENAYKKALLSYDNGVDIIQTPSIIQGIYSDFDNSLKTLVHIRRGGSISANELGNRQLKFFRENNGRLIQADVIDIECGKAFNIKTKAGASVEIMSAENLVNVAGPFAQNISTMLGVSLPISNVLQQKIAFADTASAVDRAQPFTIDLDSQNIGWNEDERELLTQDSELAFLLEELPGSIHCRPDGGAHSNRIKLGWAYNNTQTNATRHPALDNHFPEVVLRGAARINPKLNAYLDSFPQDFSHYGGYYTMTEENWPLIGATDIPAYYVATGLSGFGTMAACAAGELAALSVLGQDLPGYASALSLQRYTDHALMNEIAALQSRGIL